MEIPDWVVGRVFPQLSSSAIRVAVAVYYHGGAPRFVDGARVIYLQMTRQQLADLCHVSIRTFDATCREFEQMDLGRWHGVQRRHGLGALTLALDDRAKSALLPPESANVALFPESAEVQTLHPSCMHDDDLHDPSSVLITSSDTSREEDADFALLEELAEVGVDRPHEFLLAYGAARCQNALALYDDAVERGQRIINPGGFLRSLAESKYIRRVPDEDGDSFEARKRRYLGGKPSWG